MDSIRCAVKELIDKCSALNILEGDRLIIFEGDLYKAMADHPGYFISVDGRVLGPSGNLIKFEDHYTGYYKSHIRDKKCFVHRLVMLTFKYKPGCEDLVVVHKDGNKKNNHMDNLEWSTHQENTRPYQVSSWKGRLSEEIKTKIMSLPSGFSREDLDGIIGDI